jgi:hypothetical protein
LIYEPDFAARAHTKLGSTQHLGGGETAHAPTKVRKQLKVEGGKRVCVSIRSTKSAERNASRRSGGSATVGKWPAGSEGRKHKRAFAMLSLVIAGSCEPEVSPH